MTTKLFLSLAAVNGFLAVGLGAFGAHGLRSKLAENLFNAYQTGVHYHFYHTLALLGLALLLQRQQANMALLVSGWLFVAGIAMFCGSLYWLAVGGPKWLGPVTPLGGLCFLVGWAALFAGALKR